MAELLDGVLRYRGHGVEKSKGMRKGLIAELGPAAEAINRAALTAERVAKAGIETCVVGIGGSHVRGINSRGGISMGNRMREITREEVKAAVDRARSIALPPDREVLHLLPQEFILDDQGWDTRSGGDGGDSSGGEPASFDLLGWGGAECDYVCEPCGA